MVEINSKLVIFHVAEDITYHIYIIIWVLEVIIEWKNWQLPIGLPWIHKYPLSLPDLTIAYTPIWYYTYIL